MLLETGKILTSHIESATHLNFKIGATTVYEINALGEHDFQDHGTIKVGNITTTRNINATGNLTVIGDISAPGKILTSHIESATHLNFKIGETTVYEINALGEHDFQDNGTIKVGSITCNEDITTYGNITCHGNISLTGTIIGDGSFNFSDERIKTNIQTLDPNTAKTMFDKIEVKTYDRTFHENESNVVNPRIGFLAQDITKMFESHEDLSISNTKENFVKTQKSLTMRGTEFGDFQSVDYSRMVTILWGTVKQMDSRIKELENKLNTFETLEARIQALETQ
jgi:hypothetical protein